MSEIGTSNKNTEKCEECERPIRTAPQDESWIILLGEEHGEPQASAAFWSTGEDPNWYRSEASSNPILFKPTHWLPLPKWFLSFIERNVS